MTKIDIRADEDIAQDCDWEMEDGYDEESVQKRLRDSRRRMQGLPTDDDLDELKLLAKTEPHEFSLTPLWDGVEPGGFPSYYYWTTQPKQRAGREERWCYATKRNLGGWFLGWRELVDADGSGSRDQWFSRRKKKDVMARCQRKAGVAL